MRLKILIYDWFLHSTIHPKVALESFWEIDFSSHRMVLKVEEYQKPQMLKDIEREKKNMMYCMNPAVTVVSF